MDCCRHRFDRMIMQDTRYEIGLLVVATGKYHYFIASLVQSIDQFFFKDHDVRIFLFTDGDGITRENVTIIPIVHEPWPLIPLLRYHFFHRYRSVLDGMDFLFCTDVDMRFAAECGEEILPDNSLELVGVEHPGFCLMPRPRTRFDVFLKAHGFRYRTIHRRLRGTFETNPISTAYVRPDEGKIYYCGGVNGGTADAFLDMADCIRCNVNQDLGKNYIAVWHDESHLNRYFIDHPPKILGPSYCYPESASLPFEKILLALDKDHKQLRNMDI